MRKFLPFLFLINPWQACAASVTVVGFKNFFLLFACFWFRLLFLFFAFVVFSPVCLLMYALSQKIISGIVHAQCAEGLHFCALNSLQ